MKEYAVKLHLKGYELFTNIIDVVVNHNEHPAKKAIEFYFKNGWNVNKDDIRIDKIIRKI